MAYPASHPSGPFPCPAAAHGLAHPRCQTLSSPSEGEHQLEKLEFALAVALTRGDVQRSQQLRDAITALGGNQEEPGT
ncbi:MAG: hypothetical protein WCL59_01680 [Cyanobium sp. ELA507]